MREGTTIADVARLGGIRDDITTVTPSSYPYPPYQYSSKTGSEPPKVFVAERADMFGYAIQGWEQFDRWAQMNEPLWRCASEEYRRIGYSDEDRIKLLAYGLMCALRDRTQADIKKAMESTTPLLPIPR